MKDAGGRLGWIEWDLRRFRSGDSAGIAAELKNSGGRLRKWGALRFQYAERVQQRFASDLLEVGTEDMMEGFSERKATVFGGKDGDVECAGADRPM
jgi:hypothetical protein